MFTFNGKAATICLVVLGVSSVSASGNHICQCNNGTAATGDACHTNNTNICAACQGSFFLDNATTPGTPVCTGWRAECNAGQTEDQAPTNLVNRMCSDNTCTCNNGTAATALDCTSNNGNICSACAGSTYLSASKNCDPWYECASDETENVPPTNSVNRGCIETVCVNVTCTTPPETQCYEAAGTCATGQCTYATAAADTPCVDGIAATTGDVCDGVSPGVAGCAGTDPFCVNMTCAAAAQCRETGVCAVGTNGTCTYAMSAADSTCDDGNAATTNDKCNDAGVCAGTIAPSPSSSPPATSSATTLLSVLALAVPVWVAQV